MTSLKPWVFNINTPEIIKHKFDSYLNFRECSFYQILQVTVVLKVFVNRVDEEKEVLQDFSAPTGPKVKIGKWPDAEWKTFLKNFRETAMNFWNWKFYLEPFETEAFDRTYYRDVPNSGLLGMFKDKELMMRVRPNVQCNLHIQVVDKKEDAHFVISALYLKPVAGVTINAFTLRSTSDTYDSGDLVPSELVFNDLKGNSVKTLHNTVVHEVGHAIGLPHIGVILGDKPCLDKGNTNDLVCYGDGRDPEFIRDVMGGGTEVHFFHAKPWKIAMSKHAGISDNSFIVHTKKIKDYTMIVNKLYP